MTLKYVLFSVVRLKLECEKLANEKTEMQRHYVMVSTVFQFFSLSRFGFCFEILILFINLRKCLIKANIN